MNIEEILSKLSLEEKASLTSGSAFWYTQPVGETVPAIMMTDGPHGLRKQEGEADMLGINASVPATCFPSSATLCSSWDTDLIYRVGRALGEECQAHDVQVLLGPGVNIKRSPLCGRNFEYFSEDPYLSSHMAAGHIRGVQSQGVGACIKHYAVNNQETCRYSVDAVLDERTLREIYLASFEEAIREAKPWMVMCAYNKVNGTYCSDHEHLLDEILRKEWGYNGVVVSDWGAANDPVQGVKAGFDLRMPGPVACADEKIVQAVRDGELEEEKLDDCVRRILALVQKGIENRKKNGGMNPEATGAIADELNPEVNHANADEPNPEANHAVSEEPDSKEKYVLTKEMAAHHALAREAAAESAVLLKNDNHVLPLKRGERLAVIGSFAKNIRYQGGGSSNVNATRVPTLLDVLSEHGVEYTYARGFRNKVDVVDEAWVSEALDACAGADRILLNLGLPFRIESEGFDRKDMKLPENQTDLLNRLAALGKPIVVILSLGAPVEMPWIGQADAVLAMYTGGQAVAEATVDLLYGAATPCGKLAETWPMKLEDNPSALNYPQQQTAVYEEGIYVGYRYYEKKKMPVRFPFGYGLSYTEFVCGDLKIDKTESTDRENVEISVTVTNVGNVPGKEILQLYVAPVSSSVSRPEKELKGFAKTGLLAPGASETLYFTLDGRSFAYYNTDISDWYVETGDYRILVGASSADIRLTGTVHITGTKEIKRVYTADSRMGELMADPKTAGIIGMLMGGPHAQTAERAEEKAADAEERNEADGTDVKDVRKNETDAVWGAGDKTIFPDEDSADQAMDNEALGMDMPLGKLINFSGGAMTYEKLDMLLGALNNA